MTKLHVYLRPATLAVGVGCRKGTTSAEIFAALHDACRKVGRSCKSIAVIGSTVAKQEEIGLLAAVQQLEIPVEFYSNSQLEEAITVFQLKKSKFVEEEIGVGNVCEPAALLGGRQNNLLLPKTKYPKVAVAIAEVKYRWWESDQAVN
jgi:cobalt-precorrin 5A hydrolase